VGDPFAGWNFGRFATGRDWKSMSPSGAKLAVTLTDMRLRSTGMAVMLGFMGGSDSITANVDVVQGGKVAKSFHAEAGRTSGGPTPAAFYNAANPSRGHEKSQPRGLTPSDFQAQRRRRLARWLHGGWKGGGGSSQRDSRSRSLQRMVERSRWRGVARDPRGW
jgi:hypothetical protein